MSKLSHEQMKSHLKDTRSFSNADDDLVEDTMGHHGEWEHKSIPVHSVKRQRGLEDHHNMPPSGTHGPIVVHPKGHIIDGNHRHAQAQREGKTHIDAYVPIKKNEDDEWMSPEAPKYKADAKEGDWHHHGVRTHTRAGVWHQITVEKHHKEEGRYRARVADPKNVTKTIHTTEEHDTAHHATRAAKNHIDKVD